MACLISIIIPVYNEQKLINSLILHLKEIFPASETEIIVVDGEKSGSTINTIKDSSVIKLVSPKGRANQMNMGAFFSKGNILLFIHADSKLPENSFFLIKNKMKNSFIKAGAFDLKIDSGSFFLKLVSFGASLRSRLTKIPYGDQGIFIKKYIFKDIGGYSKIPLMEDIDLMQKLKRKKYKIIFLNRKIKTSPRRWTEQGIFFCSFRNIFISSLYYLGVRPETLVRFY